MLVHRLEFPLVYRQLLVVFRFKLFVPRNEAITLFARSHAETPTSAAVSCRCSHWKARIYCRKDRLLLDRADVYKLAHFTRNPQEVRELEHLIAVEDEKRSQATAENMRRCVHWLREEGRMPQHCIELHPCSKQC